MRALLLAAAIALAIPMTANAAPAYPVKIFTKLGRGFSNVLYSPSEIYINAYKEAQNVGLQDGYEDWTWTDTHVSTFAGGVTGVGYMFTRVGVGFFDVLTFPWPTKPVMQPPTPTVYLEGVAD